MLGVVRFPMGEVGAHYRPPVRAHNEKDSEGQLQGGWEAFYQTKYDVDAGKPQLRTFGGRQAEKFYETFALPLAPARPGKALGPPSKESLTWGIGGTLPAGRFHGTPMPAAEIKNSSKKYIPGWRSEEHGIEYDTGTKKHYHLPDGTDYRLVRSKDYYLEDMMAKKKTVPEEERCDKRTIHRMAPPGLKGYMGSEYSNDFFLRGTYRPNDFMLRATDDCKLEGEGPPAIERPPRKTFKQKRVEEELGLQQDLVREYLESTQYRIPLASGKGEVLDSDDELADPDKVAAD